MVDAQMASTTQKKIYPDTVSLPQTVVHRVEATGRLRSPDPAVSGRQLASVEEDVLVKRAAVDEMTVYERDEETFAEQVVEQKMEYETRNEVQD